MISWAHYFGPWTGGFVLGAAFGAAVIDAVTRVGWSPWWAIGIWIIGGLLSSAIAAVAFSLLRFARGRLR